MQKVKKWSLLTIAAFAILLFGACNDWEQMDPPAGNQVYPKLERIASYTFEEEIDPTIMQLYSYNGGNRPALVEDEERASRVLHLNGGYALIDNPLTSVNIQNGVSLTFWVKQAANEDEDQDLEGALISFQNENGTQRMFFTANGWLSYNGVDGTFEDNNPASEKTGLLSAGEWHYVAIAVINTGYFVYVDGMKKIDRTITSFNFSKIVQFMASVPNFYIGYGSDSQTKEMWLDDLTIYRNTITNTQWNLPGSGSSGDGDLVPVPDPVYFNNFERGLDGSSIVGAGGLTNFGANFGTIFQNVGGAQRSNYLLLPDDVLTHSSSTKELTISVWVNASNAGASTDYMWAPLFMAYAGPPSGNMNNPPVLACQYRGIVSVNTNGADNVGDNWCDYTDAQNDNGTNKVYHDGTDWLADGEWHLYTAVFTETTAAVYFDGEIANSWTISGSGAGNTVGSLFTGNELKYVCLGGNQAWDWGDNDAGFMFDDIAIYNQALTGDQIKSIVKSKEVPSPVYFNNFERGVGEATIQGSGKIDWSGGYFNNIFQNVGGSQRTNYLLLPEDVLTHSGATQQLSVSVWVNASNAGASTDYMWAPLFMAYAGPPSGNMNNPPVLACQYRGIVSVNTNGADNVGDNWCDYTNEQNDNGTNQVYHDGTDWLADGEWHLYTAVFTTTTAAVYFDGVVANSWTISGSGAGNTVGSLFTGNELKYVCLGGNQAWDWGDNDAGFMFDNFAIYNVALTAEQISILAQLKK